MIDVSFRFVLHLVLSYTVSLEDLSVCLEVQKLRVDRQLVGEGFSLFVYLSVSGISAVQQLIGGIMMYEAERNYKLSRKRLKSLINFIKFYI